MKLHGRLLMTSAFLWSFNSGKNGDRKDTSNQ